MPRKQAVKLNWTKRLTRLARYSFPPTILWFGFVLSIGFMETPLRFQPERISTDEALSIGRLVFHCLNFVEWALAVIVTATAVIRWKGWSPGPILLAMILVILLCQTVLLCTVLDHRTEIILAGGKVEPASYHLVYIVGDVAKLCLLAAMATVQIRVFESELKRRTDPGDH